MVEIGIDGIDERLTFIIDTGFDVTIIDAEVASRIGLVAESKRQENQPGGAIEVGSLPAVALRFDCFEVPDVVMTTAPISGLSAVLGRSFHGILGHDVLERFVFDLDYPAKRLRVMASEGWRAPAGSTPVAIEIRERQPLARAVLVTADGREIRGLFKLDTGSLDVAGLNLNFVEDHAVVGPDDPQLVAGGVAVGGGTEGRLFRAGALVLGARRIEAPLIGYTVDSGGFERREDAGTIGVQVLSLSRLVLDYPHQQVVFVGPASPPTGEDRTGMLLVSPPPSFDQLVVATVVAGSPAALAGLAAGDQITSLGGRSGLSLRDARELQRGDGPLEVTSVRDGESRASSIHRHQLVAR